AVKAASVSNGSSGSGQSSNAETTTSSEASASSRGVPRASSVVQLGVLVEDRSQVLRCHVEHPATHADKREIGDDAVAQDLSTEHRAA
ncbi:MAG: hypothetical protein ACRDTZ_16805, partial [Pseudonocardiaceae bacterium]